MNVIDAMVIKAIADKFSELISRVMFSRHHVTASCAMKNGDGDAYVLLITSIKEEHAMPLHEHLQKCAEQWMTTNDYDKDETPLSKHSSPMGEA